MNVTRMKDIIFNTVGAAVGAVGVASDMNVVQWISAISAIIMTAIALVRAAISTVETVRKWRDGKITAEEVNKELDDVLDELRSEGGEDNDD